MDDVYNLEVISPNRHGGIILHISSLPSKYGIGTFGKSAYEFADFLKKAGIKYWQVLPLGPTSYGDSPYQSFSSFAGNPYFIDLEMLQEDGYLKEEELDLDFGDDPRHVDYHKIYTHRFQVLKKAFHRYREKNPGDIEARGPYIEEYAAYMTIKKTQDNKAWNLWEDSLKDPHSEEVKKQLDIHQEEYQFHLFCQKIFFEQYFKLKEYVNGQGIQIIGDLPIYVAEDSADLWAHQEDFLMEKNHPSVVGGCPPDGFSEDGQLWGNPIYNWNRLKEKDYEFFHERMLCNLDLFDILRIDHFRGLESYWEIPYGSKTAATGHWVKGPGVDLFRRFEEKYGKANIIAEDLGYITEEVIEFREATGFFGMKVMQFAFNPEGESDYLPHNCTRNWVMYTGTHDNETLKSWVEKAPKKEVEFAKKYLKISQEEGMVWGIIRGAWSSVCDIAIAQIQDFLEIGDEGRMNAPSTLGNWTFRVKREELTDELAEKIHDLNKLYGRIR
ncbi:MAG: 4-alpha-glucanotransferase [Tissierellia bacterium]|nr:4-alpha-glucanotransferase [Tissierellia bacterium]